MVGGPAAVVATRRCSLRFPLREATLEPPGDLIKHEMCPLQTVRVWWVVALGIHWLRNVAGNSSLSPLLTADSGRRRRRNGSRGKQRSTEGLFTRREMGHRCYTCCRRLSLGQSLIYQTHMTLPVRRNSLCFLSFCV